MAKKKASLSTSQKVGLGVGLTTAVVTAAGAYFLYGSENAEKNRKKVKSWVLRAKAEVLEALEKAEHMTEEEYKQLVDKVVRTYDKLQVLSKTELKEFEKEMKDNWHKIAKQAGTKFASARKSAKKAAKKTTKKAAKKSSKKSSSKKTAKKSTKKAAKKSSKKSSKK